MRRRRASTLAEALMAAVILAVVGGLLVVALAQASQAGQRAILAAQARRLLQQSLEQIRSGRGVPYSGAYGPFTLGNNAWTPGQPALQGGASPGCNGRTPCSNTVVETGVPSMTFVQIIITYTADGSVLANGTTSTPP